ncbi:uncharacterized protein LOC126897684 isoform X2 [Daktulosphaira vitifoliae]|uniref:uncharacterized protein LOC126897684 isoform X2 n=1 Tax=Daktulosphaira vitifoliae TaxID=58002 RepID=UPI0021AA3AF5|nr:uncharacterized protein LOC126897684 isoform X2 [Daktulosphaira vitifoliae]
METNKLLCNKISESDNWSVHALIQVKQKSDITKPYQETYNGFQSGNIKFTTESSQNLKVKNTLQNSDKINNIVPQCEVCCGIRSPMSIRRAQNYTAHFCTNISTKKHPTTVNVSSQTSPSPSLVFNKSDMNKHFKNKTFKLHNSKQKDEKTIHNNACCLKSSDSDETIGYDSSDTLHKLSEKNQLQKSPCSSTLSSMNTISNPSSSCVSTLMSTNSIYNSSSSNSQPDTKYTYSYNNISSSDDECSETAWSFNRSLSQREEILFRRPGSKQANTIQDTGSLSDCSLSPNYQKQNYLNNYTQVAKMAVKFGTTNFPKNQDHHIGPSKNPDCTCLNCRSHFNSSYYPYSKETTNQSELFKLFKKNL